jgi:hypothetical protein
LKTSLTAPGSQFPVWGKFPASKKGVSSPLIEAFSTAEMSTFAAPPGGVQTDRTNAKTRERSPHKQTRPNERDLHYPGLRRSTSTSALALYFLILATPYKGSDVETLKALWDANSTPVCWGCQGGIPIYCISILTSGMPPSSPTFPQGRDWVIGAPAARSRMTAIGIFFQPFHACISGLAEARRLRSGMEMPRLVNRGHFSTEGFMAT